MPMPKHLNGAGMGFFLDNYEHLAARPERNAAINHFVNAADAMRVGQDVGSAMRKNCFKTSSFSAKRLNISHGKRQRPMMLNEQRLRFYWWMSNRAYCDRCISAVAVTKPISSQSRQPVLLRGAARRIRLRALYETRIQRG